MTTDSERSPYAPPKSLYGRIIRERGTTRFVLTVVVLLAIWYGYGVVQDNILFSKTWPPLKPDVNGLTLVGLKDKEKPGYKPTYMAIESNHSWQIRLRDDAEEDEPADNDTPEAKDRPTTSYSGKTSRGRFVEPSELFAKLPVVLTSAHFKGATVERRLEPMFDREYWVVHLELTDEGRARYYQFSSEHEDERVVFVLKGAVSICAKMKKLNTHNLTLEQYWVKADAEEMAAFINSKK